MYSGFGEKFRDPEYYERYPEVSLAMAEQLVRAQIAMVGMDTPSPDRAPFLVHKVLLSAGVLIIENLCNLEQLLVAERFYVRAYPIKLKADAAPARVVAEVL